MSNLISNNSDFLFIYEAIQCNPNGDPDQENKPRMDYDTNTNLVTDTRVKRYIRDYVKQEGNEIFVDMEGESKVTMDDKLRAVLKRVWDNDEEMKSLIQDEELINAYNALKVKDDADATIKKLVNKKPINKAVNLAILSGLVRQKFIDIRLFGSAFAVDGFNRSLTGAVQLNWGYSLNKVYLMDSNTIVSIMNDGNSTFGKDYRVKYSLLGFHGTINKAAAATTGMTEDDRTLFQSAIWSSIAANPTRTKLNQYSKLYVEIIYNKGYSNGHFGDLRSFVTAKPKEDETSKSKKDEAAKPKKDEKVERIDDRQVKNLNDLELNFSALENLIKENKGEGKPIKDVVITSSQDMKKIFTYGSH